MPPIDNGVATPDALTFSISAIQPLTSVGVLVTPAFLRRAELAHTTLARWMSTGTE